MTTTFKEPTILRIWTDIKGVSRVITNVNAIALNNNLMVINTDNGELLYNFQHITSIETLESLSA